MNDRFGLHGELASDGRNETDPRRWDRGRSNRDRHSLTAIVGRGVSPGDLLVRLGMALRRAFGG